ncbi:hypothetical protein [Mycobacterium sp. E2479]|uniref:hypothetical protein n=1 Tax=Mycobacterium sp. E2479 TaxID=1834134 RepID=UPI0007FE24F9|nr:hypothetical protein [Mycobacterium sp. E2479]OBH55410.1 hypothetical protein A5686_06060 [Mycobacterium sp. E2479]
MSGKAPNLNQVRARMNRTANVAAALKDCKAAELEVLRNEFEEWSNYKYHHGVAGVGKALAILVDAARARREYERAVTRQEFDAITAGLTFGYPDR